MTLKRRREDFSQHEQLWVISLQIFLNHYTLVSIKYGFDEKPSKKLTTELAAFLGWLSFENTKLHVTTIWLQDLIESRKGETSSDETLLTLEERETLLILKPKLKDYATELRETRDVLLPNLSKGWKRKTEDILCECELKTFCFFT